MEAEERPIDSPDLPPEFETDRQPPPVEQRAQAGTESRPAAAQRVARLRSQGVSAFGKADARSKGVLGVVGMATTGFMRDQGTSAAAAITYYAVIGLFPLLVMAVTLNGPLFGRDRVLPQVLYVSEAVFPVGQAGLERALVEATSASASLRVAGVILLLWSASGFLTEVKLHIDRAWLPLGGRPSSVRERGQAVLSIGLLLALFIMFMLMTWIVSPVFTLLSRVPMLNSVLQGFLAPVIEWLLVWLVVGCLVFVAYHQVTGVRVWRPAAFRAALLVIVIWQLLALGFGWWANSSFVHYDRVYGHFSLLITALLWIYLSAILVLAGAHLAASIQRRWGPAASSGTAPNDRNAM
jgi:membrane protein